MIDDTPDIIYKIATTVDDVTKHLIKNFPNLWKFVYHRHYDAPTGYRSWKVVAAMLASPFVELDYLVRLGKGSVYNALSRSCATLNMSRYDFPVYYVAKPVLEAIQKTVPPTDTEWQDIK